MSLSLLNKIFDPPLSHLKFELFYLYLKENFILLSLHILIEISKIKEKRQ